MHADVKTTPEFFFGGGFPTPICTRVEKCCRGLKSGTDFPPLIEAGNPGVGQLEGLAPYIYVGN